MIRLGLIGLGKWGRRYVETIGEMPDVKLTVAAGSEWAHRLIESVDPPLDGVILATGPESHCDLASRILEVRRVPVMIEKPIAFTSAEAISIRDQTVRFAVPVLVNHVQLFGPAYQAFKRNAGDLMLGRTILWAGAKPKRSFSALYDYGAHAIAMALDLTHGEPRGVVCYKIDDDLFRVKMEVGNVSVEATFGRDQIEQTSVAIGPYQYRKDQESASGFNSPLRRALDVFVQAIRDKASDSTGEVDSRVGLDLAIRVTAVLEECARQL